MQEAAAWSPSRPASSARSAAAGVRADEARRGREAPDLHGHPRPAGPLRGPGALRGRHRRARRRRPADGPDRRLRLRPTSRSGCGSGWSSASSPRTGRRASSTTATSSSRNRPCSGSNPRSTRGAPTTGGTSRRWAASSPSTRSAWPRSGKAARPRAGSSTSPAASSSSASAWTGSSTRGTPFLELSPLAANGHVRRRGPGGRHGHRDRRRPRPGGPGRGQRRHGQGRHLLPR